MKKALVILLSLIMVLSLCTAFAEEDFSGTVTVSLYSGTGVQEAWEAVGEAYKAKHPNVDVVVDLKPQDGYADWVKAQFASYDSTTPEADIVYGNLAGQDRNNKVINFYDYAYDTNPYADVEWNDCFNQSMESLASDGKLTEVNVTGVQVLWFYNTEIFEKVGVQPPKTWDEFIDVCDKLQAAGYQPLAVSGTFQSFWAEQMGWLAQIYADQTTRNEIEIYRSQPGDYNYDEEVDGVWQLDITDPHNDDLENLNINNVRWYKAFVKDGTIRADGDGMKTVWSNFAKVFPKYAGGENFYGTDGNGEKTLFYQQKAAIWLDGSWFFGDYLNLMDSIEKDGSFTLGADDAAVELTGLSKFGLGTFAMPSMEGEGILAPARTIEVATGFLSAILKDADHNDMVVDFLQYYSSPEGYSIYMNALIDNGGRPDGLPLIKGVQLEGELATMFDNITYIGNCQKGKCQALARGIGDNQEALRAWYTYSQDFLNGNIDVDTWASMHQENQMKYAPEVMAADEISMNDLENPQNEPTGE